MHTREQILALIEAYLDKTNATERAFSVAVANDHKFVRRLRTGAGVTLTLIEKAERYMADNPDGPPSTKRTPAQDAA